MFLAKMNTSYRCYTDLSTYCVRFFMFSWNKLSSDRVSHDLLVHCVVLMVHVAAAGGASVLLRWNEWNRRRRHRRLLQRCKSVCLTYHHHWPISRSERRTSATPPPIYFFRTFDHRDRNNCSYLWVYAITGRRSRVEWKYRTRIWRTKWQDMKMKDVILQEIIVVLIGVNGSFIP